jgi:hypothetical protein
MANKKLSLDIGTTWEEILTFHYFDKDKELEVSLDDDFIAYLNPSQVNLIINHLADQLRSIGEPIDLLNKIVE